MGAETEEKGGRIVPDTRRSGQRTLLLQSFLQYILKETPTQTVALSDKWQAG